MASLTIAGRPTPRQQQFFDARTRYTAYGGARGGGKSWALRRKLVAMCLRYPQLRALLVRRSYPELMGNHVQPLLREYGGLISFDSAEKRLTVRGGGSIQLGYCAADRDALRYQGQEYDIIAIDEATQLSEYQFSIFKACLRGTSECPRRMYRTCNPGGPGHAWVKRLFIDREFRDGERPGDYGFIPALVYDNPVLLAADPDYVSSLESLPPRLRDAWLYGRWDVFEGQFFSEFDARLHVYGSPGDGAGSINGVDSVYGVDSIYGVVIPNNLRRFAAMDYGFDMLALLVCGVDPDGGLWVMRELCRPDLTLSRAALAVAPLCEGCEYIVASPDLWNRRQDSGLSGYEIMTSAGADCGLPPMRPADDRRIPGWRAVREYLAGRLHIHVSCEVLINSMTGLLCDPHRPEDAASEPHALTHAPEALRYAVMSRAAPPAEPERHDFIFKRHPQLYDF
ncbi:MAG: terminase family protein [Eubacteriales bacterium]|nr:terminase family protein [Eubacteriales bacterium]